MSFSARLPRAAPKFPPLRIDGRRPSVSLPGSARLGHYSLVVSDEQDLGCGLQAAAESRRAGSKGHADPHAIKTPEEEWREWGLSILQGTRFQMCMAFVIIANALIIGFETDLPQYPYWGIVEMMFLAVFSLEVLARMCLLGLSIFFDYSSGDFAWNLLDVIIVAVGLGDLCLDFVIHAGSGASYATVFRIVRLLRILRIFRIIRFLKQLYMLAFGLVLAAEAVMWVTVLMVFILYVCSIVLVRTVGHVDSEDDPNAELLTSNFGNVVRTMFTLFSLMVNPYLAPYHDVLGTNEIILTGFILAFVIFGSFGMIALLTGVIHENMFEKNQVRMEEERLDREVKRNLIVEKAGDLFDDIDQDGTGVPHERYREVRKLLPHVAEMFKYNGIQLAHQDFDVMIDCIDCDDSGTIEKEEFTHFLLQLGETIRPIHVIEARHQLAQLVRNHVEKCERELKSCIKKSKDDIKKSQDDVSSHIRSLSDRVESLARQMQSVSAKQDLMFRVPKDVSAIKQSVSEGVKATLDGRVALAAKCDRASFLATENHAEMKELVRKISEMHADVLSKLQDIRLHVKDEQELETEPTLKARFDTIGTGASSTETCEASSVSLSCKVRDVDDRGESSGLATPECHAPARDDSPSSAVLLSASSTEAPPRLEVSSSPLEPPAEVRESILGPAAATISQQSQQSQQTATSGAAEDCAIAATGAAAQESEDVGTKAAASPDAGARMPELESQDSTTKDFAEATPEVTTPTVTPSNAADEGFDSSSQSQSASQDDPGTPAVE
eukprot:TRINITY_DN2518_c0_g2_i1.p1 TRINITY_DN2518_c0_g2~~TRINITY_DN2518_c0_g2_i1.p1  ORF type:complete len:781 (-),score=149.03 TRINITY_DN2518_c0_g2_i1:159-2501(-)